MLSTVVNHIVY